MYSSAKTKCSNHSLLQVSGVKTPSPYFKVKWNTAILRILLSRQHTWHPLHACNIPLGAEIWNREPEIVCRLRNTYTCQYSPHWRNVAVVHSLQTYSMLTTQHCQHTHIQTHYDLTHQYKANLYTGLSNKALVIPILSCFYLSAYRSYHCYGIHIYWSYTILRTCYPKFLFRLHTLGFNAI